MKWLITFFVLFFRYLPFSLLPKVWVASCFLPWWELISKSTMKTKAVRRHNVPRTAALSIKSCGTLSKEAKQRPPTIPKNITPKPRRKHSLRTKTEKWYLFIFFCTKKVNLPKKNQTFRKIEKFGYEAIGKKNLCLVALNL